MHLYHVYFWCLKGKEISELWRCRNLICKDIEIDELWKLENNWLWKLLLLLLLLFDDDGDDDDDDVTGGGFVERKVVTGFEWSVNVHENLEPWLCDLRALSVSVHCWVIARYLAGKGGPEASSLPASKTRSPLLSVMDFLEFFLSLRCPFIDSRTSDRQNLHACVLSPLPSAIHLFFFPLFLLLAVLAVLSRPLSL